MEMVPKAQKHVIQKTNSVTSKTKEQEHQVLKEVAPTRKISIDFENYIRRTLAALFARNQVVAKIMKEMNMKIWMRMK